MTLLTTASRSRIGGGVAPRTNLPSWPQGGQGIGSSPPYQAGSVTPWTELLSDAEMAWISWSQGRSDDLLQYATVGVGTAPLQTAMVPWADLP